MPRAPTVADWLGLLILAGLWGIPFVLNEFALAAFPPAVLVALRIFIAAIVLTVYLKSANIGLPASIRGWIPMLIMALFGSVLPFQLIAWAQLHVDSAIAGVLMAIMPLFVLTLAHFFVAGSRLTAYRVVGFLLGFVGVIFVIGPDTLKGLGHNTKLLGTFAVLAGGLSYAISSIYARRLGATHPLALSAGMMIAASFLALPGAIHYAPQVTMPPSALAIISVTVLGLLCTGIATVLYFKIVQGPGPAFLSLVNYMSPALAVTAGALILDEPVGAWVVIGLALILTGIACSELGPRIAGRLRRPDVMV